MPCTPVQLTDGSRAIVCTGRARRCACGRNADLQCDWKVATRKSGTCDGWVCARCTTVPATGKDLCREHAVAFEAWKREHLVTAA